MFVDIMHEYKTMPSVFMQNKKEMIKMNDKSYGPIECIGKEQKDLRMIDNECASCLYEAGKHSQKDILGAVIANELSQDEQLLVKLYWFRGFSLNRISADYGLPRETVRRTIERAKKKIYNSMKYVVLYDELLDGRQPVPQDFHFKIIRCTDGKELVS